MMALIKRNILVYTRDKVAFFMSFLSVIILVVLYQVFLGQLQLDAIKESMGTTTVSTDVVNMVNLWLISGLITVVSLTGTLGAFSVMVLDKEKKLNEDFEISSCPTWKLELSYVIASVMLGTLITTLCFIFGVLMFNGFSYLLVFSLVDIVKILGLIVMSCFLSAAIVLPFLSFIKTSSAFSTLSTIIGTLIGFLSGVYIAIGSVGDALAQVMTWFPLTQVSALLKNILMSYSLQEVFAEAPKSTEDSYKVSYGLILRTMNDNEISSNQMILYISICTIGLLMIYLIIKKGTKHGR
ncbi:MAG: ABC transporter permease [Lactovum sp.]